MKKGYVYIAITTLLFSSMEVVLKFVAGQFTPIQMTFSRFLFGGLVLIPFAVRTLKKRGTVLDRKAVGSFALLGFIGVAVSMTLYQLAVTSVKASVVAVLFSSNPLFVTLFAYLLLREAISKKQIMGLLLDVVGIIVIINPLNLELNVLGIAYILGATLFFSLYGVAGKRQCAKFGGVVVTCFSFLFGAAEMMALSALTHIPAAADWLASVGLGAFSNIPFFTGYTLATLPIVLYVFVGVTGVGYACYFLAMETTSAQKTSLVFFFKPALAPLLAFLILREEIPLDMMIGIVLILCGSMLSVLSGRRRLQTASAEPAAPPDEGLQS